MPPDVKRDEPKSRRRFEQPEWLCDIGAESVLKEKRLPRALVAIMKLDPVVGELRHGGSVGKGRARGQRDFRFEISDLKSEILGRE